MVAFSEISDQDCILSLLLRPVIWTHSLASKTSDPDSILSLLLRPAIQTAFSLLLRPVIWTHSLATKTSDLDRTVVDTFCLPVKLSPRCSLLAASRNVATSQPRHRGFVVQYRVSGLVMLDAFTYNKDCMSKGNK